jgi:hypothetical protein
VAARLTIPLLIIIPLYTSFYFHQQRIVSDAGSDMIDDVEGTATADLQSDDEVGT